VKGRLSFSGKLYPVQSKCREISVEERKMKKARSNFLGFVCDLDSGSKVPDERAAETNPEHPIAEC